LALIGDSADTKSRETGNMHARTRTYSPTLGRFLNRQPWFSLGDLVQSNYSWDAMDEDVGEIMDDILENETLGSYLQGRYSLYDFMGQNPANELEPYSGLLGRLLGKLLRPKPKPKPDEPKPDEPKPQPPAPEPPKKDPPKDEDKDKSRKRANQDPHKGEKHNPGKDEKGCCKPCLPNSPIWRATNPDGHGGNSCHQIQYNQTPNCDCFPKRADLPCPPGMP
jgi:hypothetical protein